MDINLGFLFLWEMLGTMLLVAIGTSVNAGVTLKKTYNSNSGWIVIAFGWGMGIMIGATVANASGGAINPAISLANLIVGNWNVSQFFVGSLAQFVGAGIGAYITIGLFWNHIKLEEDGNKILGIFATNSSDDQKSTSNTISSFFAEAFGTFILALALLIPTTTFLRSPVFAGLVVFGIGLTIGGLTGFAINPARDLMPRLVYFITPFNNKVSANWGYSWIPIVAPFVGSTIAALIVLIA